MEMENTDKPSPLKQTHTITNADVIAISKHTNNNNSGKTVIPVKSNQEDRSLNMCVESEESDSKKKKNTGDTMSDEIIIVAKKLPLIIIGSDSNSKSNNTDSICTITDSSADNDKLDNTSAYKKRKATDDPLVSSKIRFLNSPSSTEISSNDICLLKTGDQTIFKCNVTPVKVPFVYNTRRSAKRRSSADSSCEKDIKQQPSHLPKRSVSAELNRNQDSLKSDGNKIILKDFSDAAELNTEFAKNSQKNTNSNDPKFSTIKEEPLFESINASSNTNDSQNIVLFINSSQNDCIESTEDANVVELSDQQFSTESMDNNLKIHMSDDHIDQDTTVSINLDSPLTNDKPSKPQLKNKPYLSVGYSSSTPENAPLTQSAIFKPQLKHLHSDNDSDSTPPFREYNKPSKMLVGSKLDPDAIKSSNSSISPLLSNGHSDNSHVTNLSNLSVPSFDVQIHCDNNNEFLSLLIVKTDHDLGIDISRECQKLHKKIYGSYSADVSKTNSQSSVTSGGLLQLPSHPQTSFLSTSSNASSIRTNDDAFAIPLRPGRNLSCQNISRVQGLEVLKQKVDEVMSQLFEVYGSDSSHSSDRNSISNPFEFNKKPIISNGKHDELADNAESTTPKSSKKKIQNKNRRTVPRKSKKDSLPTTKEETHIDDEINSPEMVNTDPNKCQRPSTPLTSKKNHNFYFNNNNIIKSPTHSDPADSSSMPMTISKISSPVSKTDNNFCSEGTLVLAKWGDKKYYSGKVKQVLSPNKFIIRFDDGQVKTLLDDFIIFGTTKELPILGQSIYAIIEDDQTYEPSLVLSLVNNEDGTVLYKCTTDRDITVSVKASDIYVTEDQAKSIKENCFPKSPHSAPNTPRRRVNRELDLDNIIHGPRVPRFRDKCGSSKKDSSNAKASTSGVPRKHRIFKDSSVVQPKQRQESESSESGDFVIRAVSTSLEEVSGVQPEVQKTPRKIEGVKADAMLIKGISKQNAGKRCSKVNKFESDFDTNNCLGPIPPKDSTLFKDLHFLLTCTDPPHPRPNQRKLNNSSYSCSDGESQTTSSTEKEDCQFTSTPFHKERLKEQLESAGGTVYSHFEDIPKNIYSVCKLIAQRPCVTAKYIQCLGADIQALSHLWVIRSCLKNRLMNTSENALPAGWSIEKQRFVNWQVSSNDRMSSTPFKECLLLLCSDNETFIKFWGRVCTLAGGETRTINEEDLNLNGGLVIVTESDCPHEVQNKAIQDNIPLVSTIWVTQCLIEGRICDHSANVKYNFMYNDTD